MSSSTPLLDNTIEPDEVPEVPTGNIASAKPANARAPVVLTPGAQSANAGPTPSDAENGMQTYAIGIRSWLKFAGN